MTDERIHDYLHQMQTAANQAATFVEGLNKSDFLADLRTQQAVILNLIVVGEAASRLLAHDPAFAAQYAHIPWASMRGMRNRIAHGYFEINVEVVWETVSVAIPQLLQKLPEVRRSANTATSEE